MDGTSGRAFQTCWTYVLSASSGLDFKILCSLLEATAVTGLLHLLAFTLQCTSDETFRQLSLLHALFNKSASGEQDQKVLAVASQPIGVLSLCLSELHGGTVF